MTTNLPEAESPLPMPAARAASAWRDFGRNVLCGVRLAFFMPLRADGMRPSWSQLIALILLGLAVSFAIGFAFVGPKGQFAAYELPGVLFYVPLTLVAAWGTAWLARRPEQTLTVAVALVALAVPFEVINALYRLALTHASWGWIRRLGFATYYLPYAWLVLAATVAAVRLLAVRVMVRAAALVVVALVLGLPQVFTWGGSIWTERYDPNSESRSRYQALSNEDAFYLQPKLLENELAGLKRGRKGIVDLYFVGVAGYAGQDVFMKEVNSVSTLFRERFDAEGHTVRLINNAKTVTEVPIASVTALRATFTRLAELMDRDEDILFLYLTSHGSKDHQFSLDFWPLRFNTLDPATLRKLLDDSGIKRRVIVVSACYSGGFVDPLKDENSLVITAASTDRNSFGCSNKADFTYFGKAYFDEALRETYSFVKAFDIAKPKIAAREKKEDFDNSDPQIFVGGKIKPALAALEDRLEHGATGLASHSTEAAPRVSAKYAGFVDLWIRPGLIETYRKECLRGMIEASPAYYVKKDPGYFGGLNESSRQWPRLIAAWSEYADEYCSEMYNEALFRKIYIDSWQRGFAEPDLDATVEFLKSDHGRHFVAANNRVSIDFLGKLMAAGRPVTDRATKRFQEAQVQINADFKRDQQTAAK